MLKILFLPLLVAVLIPIVALYLALAAFRHVVLHLVVWSWWCARGRDVLFVYSDSPTWQAYVEERILPRLGNRAVVLNWSHRKRWGWWSLSRVAFVHFGGDHEFNPLAVVFRPLRRTRSFRFWRAFRDFKHGRPEKLHEIESELFGLIEGPRP